MGLLFRVLPYLALSGVIDESFRARLVERALDCRKQVSPAVRGELDASLNRLLRVRGFLHPAKAPKHKLVPKLCKHLLHRELFEPLLDVWLESQPELRRVVQRHLDDPENNSGDIFELDGTTVAGWSDNMTSAIARLKAEQPEFDEQDIALMLCCLADPAQIESLPTAADESQTDADSKIPLTTEDDSVSEPNSDLPPGEPYPEKWRVR